MKKLLTLGLAAGLVMAASAPASAVDVKMDGEYIFQYDWDKGYADGAASNDYQWQQVRVGATFTASEALSGYFQVQGKWQWGNQNTDLTAGGKSSPNAVAGDLFVRQAYIDWLVPGTPVKIRMGRQVFGMPHVAVMKNPAFWSSDPWDGISANYKINDMFSVAGFWGRLGRQGGYVTGETQSADVFGLVGNAKFDGFGFQPYVLYAHVQPGSMVGANKTNTDTYNNNGDLKTNSNTWWFGINGQMTLFDPLTVKADFIYGDRNYRGHVPSQHGWFVDGSISYKTPYGTPLLAAWYGSGDKKKTQNAGDKMMPGLSARNGISMGFFNQTPFNDNIMSNAGGNGHSPAGTWGVKLAMEGISFLQDLSHTVQVIYAGGTNDGRNNKADATPWRYMTEKDHFVEFDFLTTYQIYKNLSAGFAVAYVIEDFQTNKAGSYAVRDKDYENGWGMALQIRYAF